MDLKLYFAPGSCSRVPLIVLEELGVPFESRLVAFMAGEHKSPDYRALNPAGKVPTLVADGRPIVQNPAIQWFLARAYPEAGLLPLTGEPLVDAKVLGQLAWFSSDLHPLVTRIRIPQFACDIAPDRVKEMASAAMAQQLLPLERALGGQEWVLASGWSTLDAYLQWVWFRITGAEFDAGPFPNIAAHHGRMSGRPSVQRVLARERDAEIELERRGLAVKLAPAGVN